MTMPIPFKLAMCVSLPALLLGAACGSESTAPTTGAVVALTSANFDQQVLARSGATVVEFFRPTCPHCQAMAPLVERLATEYSARALVGQVNTEVDQALTARYQIGGVPTFVYFKNGHELSRSVGEQSYIALTASLDAAIAAQ
jgi:thioredoxin 1